MDAFRVVRDFLSLPFSQRRFIAERYGIESVPNERDFERDKRTIQAVAAQGKQAEFASLVEMAKSK